jgi:hypothetical protein
MAMRVWLILVCLMVPPRSFAQSPPSRPLGTWERRLGPEPLRLYVEEARLHLVVPGDNACTVHADYGMTKDGVIFGIVTSVEARDETASAAEKELLEQTFRCRFRMDEGALVISEVKIGNLEKQGIWGGRFKLAAKTANWSSRPKVEPLLAALNANARRIKALRCDNVVVDIKQKGEALGLGGALVAQGPLDFRLRLKSAGISQADIGSNAEEAWCWTRKDSPRWPYRAAHKDLKSAQAEFPIPGDPSWFMQVLGLGEYDPAKKYEIEQHSDCLELMQTTKEPDGSLLRRITVLRQNGKSYEPVAYSLEDARGKVLCLARIFAHHRDRVSGALVPRKLRLFWTASQIEWNIDLEDVHILPSFTEEQAARYFSRPVLEDGSESRSGE